MRSLNSRTITPRTWSAIDPGAFLARREVRECGAHANIARASRSATEKRDGAAELKTMAASAIA
jgi:hypothetical protein